MRSTPSTGSCNFRRWRSPDDAPAEARRYEAAAAKARAFCERHEFSVGGELWYRVLADREADPGFQVTAALAVVTPENCDFYYRITDEWFIRDTVRGRYDSPRTSREGRTLRGRSNPAVLELMERAWERDRARLEAQLADGQPEGRSPMACGDPKSGPARGSGSTTRSRNGTRPSRSGSRCCRAGGERVVTDRRPEARTSRSPFDLKSGGRVPPLPRANGNGNPASSPALSRERQRDSSAVDILVQASARTVRAKRLPVFRALTAERRNTTPPPAASQKSAGIDNVRAAPE